MSSKGMSYEVRGDIVAYIEGRRDSSVTGPASMLIGNQEEDPYAMDDEYWAHPHPGSMYNEEGCYPELAHVQAACGKGPHTGGI